MQVISHQQLPEIVPGLYVIGHCTAFDLEGYSAASAPRVIGIGCDANLTGPCPPRFCLGLAGVFQW